jgi:hypothetical protein
LTASELASSNSKGPFDARHVSLLDGEPETTPGRAASAPASAQWLERAALAMAMAAKAAPLPAARITA